MGPSDARPAWLSNMEGSRIWAGPTNMEKGRQFTLGVAEKNPTSSSFKKIHTVTNTKSYMVQKEV